MQIEVKEIKFNQALYLKLYVREKVKQASSVEVAEQIELTANNHDLMQSEYYYYAVDMVAASQDAEMAKQIRLTACNPDLLQYEDYKYGVGMVAGAKDTEIATLIRTFACDRILMNTDQYKTRLKSLSDTLHIAKHGAPGDEKPVVRERTTNKK